MPLTEQSITTAGTLTEQAIPADDNENLIDAGPLDAGRLDVGLKMSEQSITTAGTLTEQSISAQ